MMRRAAIQKTVLFYIWCFSTRREAKTLKIRFKWNSLTRISTRLSDLAIVFGVMWCQEKRVEDHLGLTQKLPNLVWDDGLANAAWQWVQHCQFYHDSSLHGIIMFLLSLVFIATHQNIAITMSSERSTTPNWADAAIHPWYAEVEHIDCRHVTRFRSFEAANRQTIRHITQLVWARTKAVGCAAIGYTNDVPHPKHGLDWCTSAITAHQETSLANQFTKLFPLVPESVEKSSRGTAV